LLSFPYTIAKKAYSPVAGLDDFEQVAPASRNLAPSVMPRVIASLI
jgi:hypothetical protein